MSPFRKLLCLDFDGVLHSYVKPWQGADVIPDPPVPGAMDALAAYTDRFRVAIHSSRSSSFEGIEAMKAWVLRHLEEWDAQLAGTVMDRIEWPLTKPPAVVTIDDRALTFDGTWPSAEALAAFQPWNKRDVEAEAAAMIAALTTCVGNFADGRYDDAEWTEGDSHEVVHALRARGYRIVRT